MEAIRDDTSVSYYPIVYPDAEDFLASVRHALKISGLIARKASVDAWS